MPLHVSILGLTAPTQTLAPPWHWKEPNEQGKVLLVPHAAPTSVGLSSTTPLQLSSLLLQSSGCGFTAPTQVSTPPRHWNAPNLHSPTLLVPHWPPTPAGLSS